MRQRDSELDDAELKVLKKDMEDDFRNRDAVLKPRFPIM